MNQSGAGAKHYQLPSPVVGQQGLYSPALRAQLSLRIGLTSIVIKICVPIAVAYLARSHWLGDHNFRIYAAGFIAALLVDVAASNYLPLLGYTSLKQKLEARLRTEGIDAARLGGVWVGFSPSRSAQIYDGNYDWDVGFLFRAGDRLAYIGDQTRFAIQRDQLVRARLGPGGSSWWRLARVYVEWRGRESGTTQWFNFRPARVRSMHQIAPQSRLLLDKLLRWKVAPSEQDNVPMELADLGPPDIGVVKSVSPGKAVGFGRVVFLACYMMSISAIWCLLLGLPFNPAKGGQALYVVGVVLVTLLIQMIPSLASGQREAE
jgi:hypothetical protein